MKRFITLVVLFVLILCLAGCKLEDISLLYTEKNSKNGFEIVVNKTADCCFVGRYICVGYAENNVVTIPDDYEGTPITRIGGYYGRGVTTPFCMDVSGLYMNAPEESRYNSVFYGDINDFDISDTYRVEELTYVLDIGKNIETIINVENPYYPHINEDGSITFYHPVLYINCSDENENFYSENGKLYHKDTNELVTDFVYPSSDTISH